MKPYQKMIAEKLVTVKKIIQIPRCQGKRKMFYKLDENKNVVPSSIEEWQTFIEKKLPTNYWIVSKHDVNDYHISTVFIGLCHNFNPLSKVPLVFETMIFNKNDKGIYQRRYSTWQEAEAGHQKAIEWVKDGCKEDE